MCVLHGIGRRQVPASLQSKGVGPSLQDIPRDGVVGVNTFHRRGVAGSRNLVHE